MRTFTSFFSLIVLVGCSSSSSITPDHNGPSVDGGELDGAHVDADGSVAPPSPGEVVDGDRLKTVYITGKDGSKTLGYAVRDVKLDTECSFGTAADGVLRCLPADALNADTFFSDPSCRTPLAMNTKSCRSSSVYARVTVAGTCGAGAKVTKVGAPYTGAVYSGPPASCSQASPVFLTIYDFFTLGAEIPSAEFVEGTRR